MSGDKGIPDKRDLPINRFFILLTCWNFFGMYYAIKFRKLRKWMAWTALIIIMTNWWNLVYTGADLVSSYSDIVLDPLSIKHGLENYYPSIDSTMMLDNLIDLAMILTPIIGLVLFVKFVTKMWHWTCDYNWAHFGYEARGEYRKAYEI